MNTLNVPVTGPESGGRPVRARWQRAAPRRAAWFLALFAAVGFAQSAAAASVTLIDKSYTVGTAGLVTTDSFTMTGPGSATVTLTDLLWPDALATLSFQLSDAAGNIFGTLSGPGTQTFQLAAGGTYYALAFGQANSGTAAGAAGFGSFGLRLDAVMAPPATVPLPAAAVLLASGVGLVGLARRRRVREAP